MTPRFSFPRSAAALVLAASALLLCSPATAEGQWYPGWLPCQSDGSTINFYPDMQGMIDLGGVLTGSASGSQSVPYSQTNGYLYSPSPLYPAWMSATGSGSTLYDPRNQDGPDAGITVESSNALYYPNGPDGDLGSASSSVNGNVSVNLVAYYKWSPYYDDGTDYPTPTSTAPPPPASANFLMQTSLIAYYSNGYQATSSAPSGMSSAASASDQYGEQAQIASPSGSYPYNYGSYYVHDSKTTGGRRLVTVPVSMINGQGIYAVRLSGTTHAEAHNTLDAVRYRGNAEAVASINGRVRHDDRAVAISSSLGQTNHKSTTRFGTDGVALPDPDVPEADGITLYSNTVQPFRADGAANVPPEIIYHANVSGPWLSNSSYHWNTSLPAIGAYTKPGTYPDGIFTVPNDPPADYIAEYSKSDSVVGKQEHAFIRLVDSNDGANATANYYVNFHASFENWNKFGNSYELKPLHYTSSDGPQSANGFVHVTIPPDSIDYSIPAKVGAGLVVVGTTLFAPNLDPIALTFLQSAGYGLSLVSAPQGRDLPLQGTVTQLIQDVNIQEQINMTGGSNAYMPTTPRMDTALANAIAISGDYSGYVTGAYGPPALMFNVTVYQHKWHQDYKGDTYDVHGYTGQGSGYINWTGGYEYVYTWELGTPKSVTPK